MPKFLGNADSDPRSSTCPTSPPRCDEVWDLNACFSKLVGDFLPRLCQIVIKVTLKLLGNEH